jgi:polyhydroxyalkanoate synthase
MQSSYTSQLNFNAITLLQKYLEITREVLGNIHLFTPNIPGIELLINIYNKALTQSTINPFAIMQCNLAHQAKFLDYIANISDQSKLICTMHQEMFTYCDNIIDSIALEEKDRKFLKFFSKQFLQSLAPDNFLHLNSKALNTCVKSNFENLLNGLENLKQDLNNSKDFFSISNVNKLAFKIGKNIVTTRGKVVYKNELIELICYAPKKKTFQIPILIVPPCINKYYVLDLSPENSFINWLIQNNFQVFLISWVNPKSPEKNFEFEEYISKGILAAAKYIEKDFKYKEINLLGYCIGGVMVASTLACHLDKNHINQNQTIFNSATFLNTMLDFSDPGEISIFIRDEIIDSLRTTAEKNGYLDGVYLYNIFNLLKSKDLIWSAYINNYIEGNLPKSFDILYWNADYVNLPAKMFNYYMENMYVKNLLISPGGLNILGSKIELSTISIPSFWVASKSDHIVPWQQACKSMKHLSGQKTFCLNSAGHVAGIINPPSQNKYSYWIFEDFEQTDPNLQDQKQHQGSWWGQYLIWLTKHSGKIIRSLNYTSLQSCPDAPGSYCL